MGAQTRVTIGDFLTFGICTHDPDTGESIDTDFAPTYRIYENEVIPPILTGSMAKLDDANTLGFYTERIACSEANGFEDAKSYTIFIQATVDSRTGGISFTFVARARIIPGVAKVTVEHRPDLIVELEAVGIIGESEHRPDLIVELSAVGMIVELEHRPDLIVGLRADP